MEHVLQLQQFTWKLYVPSVCYRGDCDRFDITVSCSVLITHADGSRGSKAFRVICDSLCLSVTLSA